MTPELRKSDGASAKVYRKSAALDGLKTAAVGDFRCESSEAGTAFLNAVATDLAAEGYQALLGPMNGDTWHSYRLVTETDGSPSFLMEPTSKPHDLPAFEGAGFAPVGRYFSARASVTDALGAAPDPVPGLSVETWDGEDPEGHFSQVFDLSTRAFANNAFYTPISRDAFLAMYMPLVPMMKRELILMARDADGALAGFLFGVPNYQEGASPISVILKTYASLIHGAGHLLSHAFHQAAHEMRFDTVIHALIHETNTSAERSRRHGATVFRRYALMGRKLT